MKKIFSPIFFFSFTLTSFSQENIEKQTQPIVAEGKRLYKSEMASWYGADIFLEQFKDREKIGGYFSYTDNEISKCIFFSNGDTPKVIGTISFDSTYNVQTATSDLTQREFTKTEYPVSTHYDEPN